MIEVLTSGELNTVQDLGRPGFLNQGIARAGAMDMLALRAANILAGNPQDAAGIEVSIFPFRLRLHAPVVLAVCGADCNASIDGLPLPNCWAVEAAAGAVLELTAPVAGARACLAFSGGIDVPCRLGSRATDLKAGFGGLEGRGLRRGDRLSLQDAHRRRLPANGIGAMPYGADSLPESGGAPVELRVLPGAEYARFEGAAAAAFLGQDWVVTPEANRMGYRLAGPELAPDRRVELFSHGILPGTVQVPPAGQPIIQLSDANTCGGYPKIAGVIGADLWKLGQAPVGTRLRFSLVSLKEALEAGRQQALRLDRIAETVARIT